MIDNGVLEYWNGDMDGEEKVWRTTDVSCINLVATNLSKLGDAHPIWPTIEPDDGFLAFSYIDGKVWIVCFMCCFASTYTLVWTLGTEWPP